MDAALVSAIACDGVRVKLHEARLKDGSNIAEARKLGIITADDVMLLEQDEVLRRKALGLDDLASE
jgi:hypothetical protein